VIVQELLPMVWVLTIVACLGALFLLLLVWGFFHLRQSQRQALDEIGRIEIGDIPSLARECIKVFDRKLGVRLDLDNCEDAAQKLDDALQDGSKIKDTFARDDFYWYFVKPVGACLGELLRRHARHEWRKQPGEAPSMKARLKDGHSEAFPFEKVIGHVQGGQPGDIVAYVELARALDQVEPDVPGDRDDRE